LSVFSAPETKSLLFLADTQLSQLGVDAVSLRIEAGKVIESLREDTFLEKSLPVVTLVIVGILDSKHIPSSSLFLEEGKAIASGKTFLEIEDNP